MQNNTILFPILIGLSVDFLPRAKQKWPFKAFLILTTFLGVILLAESYGPSFEKLPSSSFTFSNTTGGVLDCPVSGEPPPTITWLTQDGSPLAGYPGLLSHLSNGSLHYNHFSPERWRSDIHDSYVRCQASNVYGSVVSTLIHVKGGEQSPTSPPT